MDNLLEAIERMRKASELIHPVLGALWIVPDGYMVEVLALAETMAKAMDDEAGR